MGRSYTSELYANVKFKAVLLGYDVKERLYGASADCCDPDTGGGWQDPTQGSPVSSCCVVKSFCKEYIKTPVFELQTLEPNWRLSFPRAVDGERLSRCMLDDWGDGTVDQSEVDPLDVSGLNDLITERETAAENFLMFVIAPEFESTLGECTTPPNGSHIYQPGIPHGICFWEESYTLISENQYREPPPTPAPEISLENFDIDYIGHDVEVETECES